MTNNSYQAAQFGDTPKAADILCQLIVNGCKTATCSALWEYDVDNEPIPEPGQRFIVVDGQSIPRCIIEITDVEIRKLRDIDAQFACDEGEGDLSLKSWRREHWRFFEQSLRRINREPRADMPLVCERFRVIELC
jgi:uncharacterized protein YhfF